MPIDPRRVAERNEFTRDFMESELSPTQAKKTGKADKAGRARRAGHGDDNVTVEHSDSQNAGSGQSQQVALAPPTVDPAVMMMLVQSLSSKTNADNENATGDQMALSNEKMHKGIKKYEDNVKKEAEEKKKAHHKKSVGEWIEGAVDVAEFAVGAALAITGVGTVAGVALMATATVNAVDLALTASGAVHGEGAKILGGVTIAADVCIAVCTLGVGISTGIMNAALEGSEDLATTTLQDGIQQGTKTATKEVVKEVVEEVAEETAKETTKETLQEGAEQGVDHAGDAADSGDSSDVNDDDSNVDDDSGDESSDVGDDSGDQGGLKQLEKMFDQELDEQFADNFVDDTVDDAGDSGDDNVPKRTKGQIIKAAVKATFGMYTKGAGIAGAATGADQTWIKVEGHELSKKADDYASDALDASKQEAVALADINSAIGQMQNQVDAYAKISKALTDTLQQYESSMTDTGIRGFA